MPACSPATLDLLFAGIDLKETPDGRVLLLRGKSLPGLLYYERHTGQPISTALADLLHRAAPPPAPGPPRRDPPPVNHSTKEERQWPETHRQAQQETLRLKGRPSRRSGSSPTPRSASSRCATSPPSSGQLGDRQGLLGRQGLAEGRLRRAQQAWKEIKEFKDKEKEKDEGEGQGEQEAGEGEARDQGAEGREARAGRRVRPGSRTARPAHRSGDPRAVRHVGAGSTSSPTRSRR